MTVASTLSKKQYQGNNLTTEFPLPFQVTAKEHIFAMLRKGSVIQEIKTNYAVDLERKMFIYPVQGEALKTGESLTVYRKIPLTQIVDLENAGAFHPEVLEHDGFDRIVMQIQQIDEEISRALKVNMTDTRDTSFLVEELFAAREEAVLSAKKALEQAQIANGKAEKAQDWAEYAEEKVRELTELSVQCSVSNDGQGNVIYDKDRHLLEIVLPFDNSGSQQSKMILTDRVDLARSDIGASAKAAAKLFETKLDKSAVSSSIDSTSEETLASSKALSALKERVPSLSMASDNYVEISMQWQTVNNNTRYFDYVPPCNGYLNVVANFSKIARESIFALTDNMINYLITMTPSLGTYAMTLPVRKGKTVRFYYTNYNDNTLTSANCRFSPMAGEVRSEQ